MYVIGLDIGTTTLSAVALDIASGDVIKAITLPNGADMPSANPWARLQDADMIANRAISVIEDIKKRLGPAAAIGIDGQMHGMLYVDREGRAASPLHTWQDGRGDQPFEGGTYASILSALTGCPMATGYGLTTHFWYLKNRAVPENAAALCTIFDYVGMRLTGRARPLTHISGAASMGLFDQERVCWDEGALLRAGIEADILPEVTSKCEALGNHRGGAPVSLGIGDNQASFIGSVREPGRSLLINMGTGGQVSMMTDAAGPLLDAERRPLSGKDHILVGSSLCGGRAYALIEKFLRGCAALAGYHGGPLYEAMNQAGLEALGEANPLIFSTLFCGTRRQPLLRGAIGNIGPDNLSAGHLIAGALWGMADELYGYYSEMIQSGARKAGVLIGSGNAIRKNPALRLAFERRFDLPMSIPAHMEEAAYGAALFGLTAAGRAQSLEEAQKLIRYI